MWQDLLNSYSITSVEPSPSIVRLSKYFKLKFDRTVLHEESAIRKVLTNKEQHKQTKGGHTPMLRAVLELTITVSEG
jgi:hypothetical protein